MIIGEEEMKNERQLLTVEDGPLMQGRESVRYLSLRNKCWKSANYKTNTQFYTQ